MTGVLFTGGGTAGHVIPVIPLIQNLSREGIKIAFVGSNSGLEEEILRLQPVDYYTIPSGKLRRYFSWRNITDVFRVFLGIIKAYYLIGKIKPSVVFSKGGFVSFPVVVAARLRFIPILLHESDCSPGLANRLSMPFAGKLFLNFPDASSGGFSREVIVSGTPVRQDLIDGDRQKGRNFLGVSADKPLLLVTGGSLGASSINESIRDSLASLTTLFAVVHICGSGNLSRIDNPNYIQYDYVGEHWGDILAASDLVVSRAGANILYELLVLKKPNILIPLSRRVSRGDQIENATYAHKHGYSQVILEEDLNSDKLVSEVFDTWAGLSEMKERLTRFDALDATTIICEELRSYLGND